MDNWFKWLVSVVCGAVATFYQQYGLLIVYLLSTVRSVNRVRVSGYRV